MKIVSVIAATIALGALVGCGKTDDPGVTSERCIVRLHGKGGGGEPAQVVDGVAVLAPAGNGEGWGGRQWEYATPDDLNAAIEIVDAAADGAGCERAVLHGFSNGASLVAALICSGSTLDGRLVGAVVDDPVTDDATVGCRMDATVDSMVYWTGALDETAPPGTSCDVVDWTCKGTEVRGIEAFTLDMGVSWAPSPYTEHRWYLEAPEPLSWLAD